MINVQTLCKGAQDVVGLDDLPKEGQLSVKAGFDPTSPYLHFGHLVLFRKLRQMEALGCKIKLVIGDFTAAIGDPTGRNAQRPPLTAEEIAFNSKEFVDIMRGMLKDPLIGYNSAWFNVMKAEDLLRLQSKYTISQMLDRKDFRARFEAEKPISLHEMTYPLLQGFDSIRLHANIELGGIDQKFNLLVGRELQKAWGQVPQVCIMMPLLLGLDGEKMSKSAGNHICLTDSPRLQFARLMAVPDGLVDTYRELLTTKWRPKMFESDDGPSIFEFKKQVSREILADLYDEEVADRAMSDWVHQFSKREQPESIPVVTLPDSSRSLPLAKLVFQSGLANSISEASRKIKEGAVYFDSVRYTSPNSFATTTANEVTLKLGRHWRHLVFEKSL